MYPIRGRIRAPRTVWLAGVSLLIGLLPSLPAQAANSFFPGIDDSVFWVNCNTGHRTYDCIEKIELLGSDGQWITGQVVPNPTYVYGIDKTDGAPGQGCGSNESSRGDACYVFPGKGANGTDLMVWALMGVGKESVGGAISAVNGPVISKRKSDGYAITGLPVDSTWRLTLRSTSLAKYGGWLQGAMKNPSYSVLPNQAGAVIVGQVMEQHHPFIDDDACGPTARPTAQSFSNYFTYVWHFNVTPYIYQMEKAQGLAPGGLIVSHNGTCGGGAFFDAQNGVLGVSMGGAHFAFDGTENKGFVEATMRGDFLRKAFGVEPKTLGNVKVEVSYTSGEAEVATSTTKYEAATDTVEIRGYGFHFSAPTVRMKIKAAATSSVAPGKTVPKKATIICSKGKATKKVTAVAPKCPAGWKKKG